MEIGLDRAWSAFKDGHSISTIILGIIILQFLCVIPDDQRLSGGVVQLCTKLQVIVLDQ